MPAKKDIPPVPPAPEGSTTPPVEPAPTTPPVEPAPVEPIPAPSVPEAARVDPYAAPAPATPAAPAYAPAYAAGPAQGLSIASMVLGIVGVLLSLAAFGFLPALAAVITGHLAQKRQPYAKPFWLTGIITGYAGIAISLIYGAILLAAIVIPLIVVGSTGRFS